MNPLLLISSRLGLLALVALLSLFRTTIAAVSQNQIQWIQATDSSGETVYVPDDRKPSLYTGNFGDCLGKSLINVTRFDAAYYKDNMTVLFHLAGTTALQSEALMMYIAVYAYGESRFDLTFNPCNANINSLCPVRSNVSIEASGIIPVSDSDVANIPSIALSIPDFEGEAILRIFANSTQEEIGCYAAVVTNGATFSEPAVVGSILGIFTIVAIISSLATAIYGEHVPVMRKHYAHSMSVFVVFAVFHHIFFTGALSMNWPSVLVAFWSNYAWASGMIYSKNMQNSINQFIGSNRGNVSQVGAAGVGVQNNDLGGGYNIHQIYGRSLGSTKLGSRSVDMLRRHLFTRNFESRLAKRQLADASDGFTYYGQPVKPGLPLPGNFSGLAGTLGQEDIPVSNAFITGFLWLLIVLAIVGGSVVGLKWILEGLASKKWMKQDRLAYFRTHWVGYTILGLLRTCFIAFFMIMLLTIFQFTFMGGAGAIALAAIVFAIFFVGMFGAAAYAYYFLHKHGDYTFQRDGLHLERRRVFEFIPWYHFHLASSREGQDSSKVIAHSLPFWSFVPADRPRSRNPEKDPEITAGLIESNVHNDIIYTKKFGWLFSRFRRTRWWFFGPWLLYEFVRASFFAGASGHAMVQVFGLLIVEMIAFVAIIMLKPFEGQRLNAIVVYLLGFSKVVTVALSAAFDVRFNLARIPCTVIGIVIIIIQSVLTIVLLIGIIIGAITSYFSVTRNRESIKPRRWMPFRERYFRHLDAAEKDIASEPAPAAVVVDHGPRQPYFSVNSVRRLAKIEDEDAEFQADIRGEQIGNNASSTSLPKNISAPTSPFPKFSGSPIPEADELDDQLSPMEPSTPDPNAMLGDNTAGELRSPKQRRLSRPPSRPTSTQSNSSTSLPFGARVHRLSWTSRDFAEWQERERAASESKRSKSLTLSNLAIEPLEERPGSSEAPANEELPESSVRPPRKSSLPIETGDVAHSAADMTAEEKAVEERAGLLKNDVQD